MNIKKNIITVKNPKEWTNEEMQSVVGFFDLLLKIDRRSNSQKYVRKHKRDKVQKYSDELIN